MAHDLDPEFAFLPKIEQNLHGMFVIIEMWITKNRDTCTPREASVELKKIIDSFIKPEEGSVEAKLVKYMEWR